MRIKIQPKKTLMAFASMAISLSTVAACSSSGSSSASPSSSASTKATGLAAGLPAEFQGGMTVGISNNIPPLVYENSSGTLVGLDVDLINALSKEIGVSISIQSVPFADLLIGLSSGKYATVGDTTIDDARKKLYNQLEYLVSSASFGELKTSAAVGTSLTDVCGMTVAVIEGADTIPYVTDTIDPACKAAGKSDVVMKQYPDASSQFLALKSGNAQLQFGDTSAFGYEMTTKAGDVFRYTGPQQLLTSPSGFSFLKSDDAVTVVFQKALAKLIADGEYATIFKKWGMSESAVKAATPPINPATSS